MNGLRALIERWAALPRRWRVAAALLWAAAIWFLSSRPSLPAPGGVLRPLLHNGAHAVVYAVLGALVLLALHGSAVRRRALAAGALATLWGVIDEVHQAFVPRRSASVGDALTDAAGAVLGIAVTVWLWRGERRAGRIALATLPLAIASVGVETFVR